MVLIEAGRFTMGSPSDEPARSEDEGPQHQVSIVRPFAIARCETTVREFRRFVEKTRYMTEAESGQGCYSWNEENRQWEPQKDRHWRNPGFAQTDTHPVVCVSWNDAVAYAQWLSEQTGQRYRLPTEAEWEYVARAGTRTPFWTGACIHTDQANYGGIVDYNDCGADTGVYRQQTVEAGSLPGNPWGLYEVAGNVWEWVQDCWHDDYQGAPQDGSAWEEPGCARRVVRGGGWGGNPVFLRSAYRFRFAPDGANFLQGFRLARDL
ncbi:MAG: formylglycine-generating enzyme family protein [Candidatus Competibacteraceae bacterium]|nr:formylglycine-generating enzyme family protein [Candidatus Competibacteraceae bacterium]